MAGISYFKVEFEFSAKCDVTGLSLVISAIKVGCA